MKEKLGPVIFSRILYFYLLLTFIVFTPLYNYQYANKNGFIEWLVFGEVVATAKAFIWPYYALQPKAADNYWTEEDYNSDLHYINSKKSCDEALKIIVTAGSVSNLSTNQSKEIISLLNLSISEANKVNDEYLKKINPYFFQKYNDNYKKGLNVLLNGLKSNNQIDISEGSFAYNEFVEWTKSNDRNLNFPK